MTVNWLETKIETKKSAIWFGFLKIAVGLSILLALISFDRFDPTPFNLLRPVDGIQNWLGMPGSLIAGFLLDILGFMAYSVPLTVLLLTRKTEILFPKLLFSETVEILSLCTLVALLLPLDYSSRLQIIGIWGYVSAEALSGFPGRIYAILILTGYQLLYIKENRLDYLPAAVLMTLVYVVSSHTRKALYKIRFIWQRASRYGAINWISPLMIHVHKLTESLLDRVLKKTVTFKDTFGKPFGFAKITSQINAYVGKKPKMYDTVNKTRCMQSAAADCELMSSVIETYLKRFYISDSKAFLKLEEEI